MNLVGCMRLAMVVVVAWPFLVAAAAMVGVPSLTATVALLPLVAAVTYLVVRLDPLLGAQLLSDARVLRSWQTIRTVILVELAIGAYLSFVPVQAKPFLLVQLALVLTILVLSQAGGFLVRLVPWVAGAIFAWLTASFFWHSLSPSDQEQLKAKVKSLVSDIDHASVALTRRPQEPQAAVSRPTVTPAPANRRDLFQEARRTLPGVIKEIYAALNDGNPRAAALHLGSEVLGDARTLDLICRPFSYRAHHVDAIADRPGHGFVLWVRALFKPVEEHAYQFTFAYIGGRFVLVRAVDGVLFEPDTEAKATTLARKFVYAGIAGEREIMAQLTTLDLSGFFDSAVMRALHQGSISEVQVRMRSDRGLKAHVTVTTARKDSGACEGLRVTLLIESVAAVPKIVAMRWSGACTSGESLVQEDPQLETYTLQRFGLLKTSSSTPPKPGSASWGRTRPAMLARAEQCIDSAGVPKLVVLFELLRDERPAGAEVTDSAACAWASSPETPSQS